MEQLSRPYKIALGAMFVLALAWFTVLKPSSAESVAAPPPPLTAPAKLPGQQGLATAVTKAKGAVATSTAAAAATERAADAASQTSAPAKPTPATGATGATGTTGAAGRTPSPPKPADASAPLLRELRQGKVAVLLFFSKGSDDSAVRRALLTADRHAGKVSVRAVPIARVGDYAAIIRGVPVAESPTVLVVGADRRARTLVGFVDTRSIDQLVGDVGGRAFRARRVKGYKGRIENLCAVIAPTLTGTAMNAPDLQERLAVVRGALADTRRVARTTAVPKRYEDFHAAFVANLQLTVRSYAAVGAATRAGTDAAAAYAPFKARVASSVARVELAAKRAGLAPGC